MGHYFHCRREIGMLSLALASDLAQHIVVTAEFLFNKKSFLPIERLDLRNFAAFGRWKKNKGTARASPRNLFFCVPLFFRNSGRHFCPVIISVGAFSHVKKQREMNSIKLDFHLPQKKQWKKKKRKKGRFFPVTFFHFHHYLSNEGVKIDSPSLFSPLPLKAADTCIGFPGKRSFVSFLLFLLLPPPPQGEERESEREAIKIKPFPSSHRQKPSFFLVLALLSRITLTPKKWRKTNNSSK